MKVRVVEAHERRTLAWIVSVMGGLLTAAVLLHAVDLEELLRWDRPWSFAVPSMIWAAGLSLAFRRRPYLAEARRFIAARRTSETQVEVGVARADRGCSVALTMRNIARPQRFYFLEVEREADARRLVERSLRAKWPGGGVVMSLRRDGLALLQRGIAALGGLSGFMYGFVVGALDDPDYKAIFGLPALIFCLISSVLFVVEPLTRRTVMVGKETADTRGAVSDHLTTHAMNRIEHAKAANGDEQHLDARIRVLDRGADEALVAWLTRIDAMGEKKEAGYRDAAFSNEELERVARDSRLPSHARLGATRLLLRRAPEAVEGMRFRIVAEGDDVDPAIEQRARVVLGLEDPTEAAEALERLGPSYLASRPRGA